jgi:hypothetical protein
MLMEQQIGARRERADGSIVRILSRPNGNLYGDYAVLSASKKNYRVATSRTGVLIDCTFKRLGTGPLVGTRTWGGLIGIGGYPRLIV